MKKFLKQLTLVLVFAAVVAGGKGKHNQAETFKIDLPFWYSLESNSAIETNKIDLPFWYSLESNSAVESKKIDLPFWY